MGLTAVFRHPENWPARRPSRRPALALLAALALLTPWPLLAATPAQAAALVTIVEGEATVIDGNRTLVATEGLKLGDETLVRTGSSATLLRVEWPDGSVADFGPDTQAMIAPGGLGSRGGRAPAVYLLRGWLKLGSLGTAPTGGLVAPRLDVQPFKGSLVVLAGADETWVFAESGSATLAERDARPAAKAALKSGEVWHRSGTAKGSVAARPTPAQMQRVPRGFRDTLPLRSAALAGRTITAKPAPAPSYADLREWLTAERPLRRNFTRRFGPRVQEASFRAALADNLAQHPEWEPVLFPERFEKPAPR